MSRFIITCLLSAAFLAAQIGSPYQPRYPGVPGVPGQQPGQGRTRRTQKRESTEKEADKTVRATGKIVDIQDKSWTIQADDTRYLAVKINDKTRFTRDGKDVKGEALNLGDRVRLEATPDDEQNLTATLLEGLKPEATKTETTKGETKPAGDAVTEMEVKQPQLKPAPPDAEDPGRPHLARGVPAPRPHTEVVEQPEPERAPTPTRAAATAAPERPEPGADPLLQRARAVAMAFTDSLPNFEVQQITTRYQSAESGRNWKADDNVTSDVTFRSGKEDYKNIKINNRLVNKDMMDIPGARSTGEFGTTLMSLFSPGSHTEFKKLHDTTISNRSAVSYSYVVQRPYSDYRIFWGSQYIVPGYSGRVWIDKDTARVLRIEIQADAIPKEFPLDKVEAAIDYGPERMGSESYIVPIAAENLSCLRGTAFCGRNAISWRNYRLYKGEATITFEAK